jgi:hypothetical protein
MNEQMTETILDKLGPGWRERTTRRRSLWHIPKVLLIFILFVSLWFALFRLMWLVHLIIYPEHSGHLHDFWGKAITAQSFTSSFLLLIPLFLPATGLSLIFTNLVFWCIPPARIQFEKEGEGIEEMTFRRATKGLFRITIRWLIPIGFGLSMLGALTLANLK